MLHLPGAMKTLLVLFGILSTFLHAVESRMCITCKGSFGCGGPVKNCTSAEDTCLSMHMHTLYDRVSRKSLFVRTCGATLYCFKNGTMTSPYVTIYYTTSCCNTDSCTGPPPIFSDYNEMVNNTYKPNLCPACLADDTNPCAKQYAMPCIEEETECVSLTQTSGNVSTVRLGCASKDFCGHEDILNLALDTKVRVICNASTTNSMLPVHFFRYCSQYTIVQSDKVYDKLDGAMCSQEQDACMMEINKIKAGGQEVDEQIQKCGKSSECDRNGIVRNPNKLIQFSTSCCYSDLCIVRKPELSTQTEKPAKNGLHCKSCFSSTYDQCDNQETMQCTGNETQCVRYIATMTQGKEITNETLYGCTTEKICHSGNRTVNYGVRTMDVEITCVSSRSPSIFYVQQISLQAIALIILSPLTANYMLKARE